MKNIGQALYGLGTAQVTETDSKSGNCNQYIHDGSLSQIDRGTGRVNNRSAVTNKSL